jgi:hypothetical protein
MEFTVPTAHFGGQEEEVQTPSTQLNEEDQAVGVVEVMEVEMAPTNVNTIETDTEW